MGTTKIESNQAHRAFPTQAAELRARAVNEAFTKADVDLSNAVKAYQASPHGFSDVSSFDGPPGVRLRSGELRKALIDAHAVRLGAALELLSVEMDLEGVPADHQARRLATCRNEEEQLLKRLLNE